MPQTRSTASSDKPLTRDELELYTQRLEEKETRLREQAEALYNKQQELEQRGREMNPDSQIMKQLIEKLATLSDIPAQIDALNRRISVIQNENEGSARPDISINNTTPRGNMGEESSPIRLKDVIDTIPKYNGHNMTVQQFTKICERALELIPQYHEYHLAQLIINKLQGHAYIAIDGVEYYSVNDILKRLKLIFGPNKSVDQYRGELANVFMKSNENIFDYISRVQELKNAIIDGERPDEEGKLHIERKAAASFINGLPPDLLVRVKLEHHYSLEDNIVAAIQLSKTMEIENSRRKSVFPNRPSRADPTYVTQRPPQNSSNNNSRDNTLQQTQQPYVRSLIPGQARPNFPATKICNYCKTPGHFMNECRKLAYRRTLERNSPQPSTSYKPSNQGNSQGVPMIGVRRNETQEGRQVYTQPPPVPVNVNAIPFSEKPPQDLEFIESIP